MGPRVPLSLPIYLAVSKSVLAAPMAPLGRAILGLNYQQHPPCNLLHPKNPTNPLPEVPEPTYTLVARSLKTLGPYSGMNQDLRPVPPLLLLLHPIQIFD